MKMSGDQRITASRQKVWEALNDPVVLKQCIPGCQSLERESDTRMKATVTIKLGPISARFTGTVTFSDVDPPNGYTISGEGQGGAAGSAKGSAKVQLSDDGGGATRLIYEVDAQVGGRLAQLGGPVIDATAKQLAGVFFKKFGEVVSGATPDVGSALTSKPVKAGVSQAGSSSSGFTALLVLALGIAAIAGFLLGRADNGAASDWIGISISSLVVVVAAVAFAVGRRMTTITLDAEALERLAQSRADGK